MGTAGASASRWAPAWDLEAEYLALGIVNWTCTLSPQRIILGGGVMQRQELFPKLRARVAELLNGYLEPPEIVPAVLGRRAGVLGALVLAARAVSTRTKGLPRFGQISRHNC